MTKTEERKGRGRPTLFSEEVAEELCTAIATSTKGLYAICAASDTLPSAVTVYAWLAKMPEFLKKYEDAKGQQMLLMAEEIIEIADETSRDTIVREDGGEIPNSEWIARSRLRVDTRKWLMSKLAPKKYGEKLDLNQSGTVNVVTTHMTRAEFNKRLAESRVNAALPDGK